MNSQDFENDDSHLDDYTPCEHCGEEMEWQDCWDCGGEGGRDGEDLMMEDPLWYGPDDFETCSSCLGKGGYWICHNSKNHIDQTTLTNTK
jgi:hypothetical protein